MAKNQAKAKQHHKSELLLFENYSHFSSRHQPNIIGYILKNKQKNKCVYIHTINHNKNEDENKT